MCFNGVQCASVSLVLQTELSDAKAELEQLRDGRDRIEALVENISRQRDMYKSLLSQSGGHRVGGGEWERVEGNACHVYLAK